jgi:HK97 family phage portal protein
VSLIRRLVERRWFEPNPEGGFFPETGTIFTGEPVTEHTALNHVAYYACVRTLTEAIASLPWDAYRKRDGFSVEVEPQPPLLTQPYVGDAGDMTDVEWKGMAAVSLVMRGNFYGRIVERNALEFPTQVMPLHPDWVSRQRERSGSGGLPTGPVVTRVGGDRVPNGDILHVRGMMLPGALAGLSPLNAARHAIGLGLAAQRFGGQWFGDGAAPSSMLTTEQNLPEKTVRQVQQNWVDSHSGRRLPAVLTGGFKWEPITITPEESQFLATREFSVKEMAMLVGLPPHMIGDTERTTSWGSGIEHQSIGFVTYSLRSWLTRIESAMSRLLPRGQFVKFNVDALLRGDLKSRYEAHRISLEAGFKNPDEVRALEDLPPIPGGVGQGYRQPLNFGPLGTVPAPRPEPTITRAKVDDDPDAHRNGHRREVGDPDPVAH